MEGKPEDIILSNKNTAMSSNTNGQPWKYTYK